MKRKKKEQFADQMSKYYAPRNAGPHGVNSPHAKQVTFQVTEACNLACTYCYQGCKSKKRMSLETGKKIVDMLLASDERTNCYITCDKIAGIVLDFIGGEPFLEVELIDQIMDYFVEQAFLKDSPLAYRYRMSISTNGTLYFTPEVQAFIKKWGRHLSLGVSIDGNKKLHDACRVFPDGSGSYDIAHAAAMDFAGQHGHPGSKMTIAPGNVMYVAEAAGALVDEGYDEVYLNCVFEEGWTLEHAQILYQQLKMLADHLLEMDEPPYVSIFEQYIGHRLNETDNQNWCGGTGCMLAFDPDGNAFPCLRYMGSSLNGQQEPYVIGDLEHGLMRCQEHIDRVKVFENITRRSQSTDECWNCPIASGCAWCSAYNYQVFGTPDKRATFICIMHKARVLANVYYFNKRKQKDPTIQTFELNVPKEWAVPIIGEDEYEMLKRLEAESFGTG